MWSLGAGLVAPIYQGGALKAQVEIRTAEQKQAVAEYARVALRAFGDVEGAMAGELASRSARQILRAARGHAERPRTGARPGRLRCRDPSICVRCSSSS